MKKPFGIFMAVVTVIAACVGFVGCKKEKNVGELKSLEEAYEAGWLTQEDLKTISYYYNDRFAEENPDFTPAPKIPEELEEKTAKLIKYAYRQTILENKLFHYKKDDLPLDTMRIGRYYGFYHDCVVLNLYCTLINAYPIFEDCEIGGVAFYSYSRSLIAVWKLNENESEA